MLRFTRVVFGLTSSPFILNATLKHHVTQYANVDPDFVNEVMRSLYVDDFASGSRDVKSALQLSTKVKTRLTDGGFNMRKWTSNSQELMEELQKNPTFSKSEQSINTDNSTSTTLKVTNGNQPIPESNPRVLGQIWNTSTDQLKIDLTKILDGVNHSKVTKRIILSTTAKFYDPLGLISPIVLMFKLLFQQLCKSDLSWDEILNEDMTRRWQIIINSLKDAIKRDKYLKTVLEHFWRRWSSEYLTQLREHRKPSQKHGPVVNVGDVVSVQEDNVKRLNWQMALVDELIRGKDGKTRAAVVRIMDKAGKITRLRRPLQKNYIRLSYSLRNQTDR